MNASPDDQPEQEPSRGASELGAPDDAEEVQGAVVDDDPPAGEIVEALIERSFRGPVPSPDSLREYEEVLPGCAERLVSLTERQSKHRQEMERKVVETDSSVRTRGQIFAFLIGMTAIIGGIVLIAVGKDIAGFVTLVGTLGTLLGVFIYGQVREGRLEQAAAPEEDGGDEE